MLIWKLIDRYLGFCNPKFFVSGGGRDTAPASTDVGDIGHSLRFRYGASSTLTHAAVSDAATYQVHSMWVKRGQIGVARALFQSYLNSGNYSFLVFNASDQLEFRQTNTSVVTQKITNAVFRDPTVWLHIVLVTDTSQASGSKNRIYVDGVEQTYATNNDASTTILWYSAGYTPTIGYNAPFGVYSDMYLARYCFTTGAGVTPSSFGYLNTEINKWVTKTQAQVQAVVDAGGVNSFMLDFDNGTSLTTLGNDKSVKGNNWTLNNFSLTAGSTYDHMLDVPGNTYATLNPLRRGFAAYPELKEGNLFADGSAYSSAGNMNAAGTILATGKTYFETVVAATNLGGQAGVMGFVLPGSQPTSYPGSSTGGFCFTYGTTWGKRIDGGTFTNISLTGVTAGDVMGVAFDPATGSAWVSKNGVWNGSGDPSTGANPDITGIPSTYTEPVITSYRSGGFYIDLKVNFGQRPFAYTPPTGFKALCQANLPTPATKNPKKHFDAVTWAGDGSASKSITGCEFQPDLAWSKARNAAYSHRLFDSVRGVGSGKSLYSDLTSAEGGINDGLYGYVSAMINGGFTAVNGSDAADAFLESGKTYTAWLWKAGGAPVTNNAGSIQSQVSANVEAGFSIVTYATAAVASQTIGHGLLQPPELVVLHWRDAADDWFVYSKDTGNTKNLRLNTTAAAVTSATPWNNTSPTSSVFTLGPAFSGVRQHVAYCFHSVPGYSKIGSYTGNGSADGPFVYCGFKPRFLLVKRVDSTSDWVIIDTSRSSSNVADEAVWANLSSAEGAYVICDALSNGFKPRESTNGFNVSGGTYIFYAVAEVAGKYS